MSHLRPIDRETGEVKATEQYTIDEVRSALAQLNDVVNLRLGAGLPLDKRLARQIVVFAKQLDRDAKNTDASDALHPEVVKAAAA